MTPKRSATMPYEAPPAGEDHADRVRELARIRDAYARRRVSVPAGRYSSNDASSVLAGKELERRILRMLAVKNSAPLSSRRILDLGCGEGHWLRRFEQWGAAPENLAGIDLLPERIAAARERSAPRVHLQCGDASRMAFAHGTFDTLLTFVVFSSILDRTFRQTLANEMLRVLRPGGFILWYDFHVNNPWNPDVSGVSKKEIREYFSGCRVRFERITLAPPLGRMVARSPRLYALLSATKFLCTHYLGWIQKP